MYVYAFFQVSTLIRGETTDCHSHPRKGVGFFPRFLCLWSPCGRCVWPAILTPSPHPTSVWLESPGPMTQLMVVSGTVNSSYCCSIGRFSHLGVKDFFSHIQIHSAVGTLKASYLRTAAATLKAFGALQSCALSQPQTSGFNGPCEKVSFNMEKNENIRGARTLEYLCGSTSCKQICNFVGYNSTILGHLLHQAAYYSQKKASETTTNWFLWILIDPCVNRAAWPYSHCSGW